MITGANGYIGRALCTYFAEQKWEVVGLVRNADQPTTGVKQITWNGKDPGEWCRELEGTDLVINLVGKSVNCRYTRKNKAEIYASRLDATRAIGLAIEQCRQKPKVWMNAASATIYAHSETVPNTEFSHVIGEGFSVDVCQKWEALFFSFKDSGVRQIAMRTAIVLSEKGSVMDYFNRLVKLGFGGRMGAGTQWFSWIHLNDLCRAIHFCYDTETLNGAVNFAAPQPVTNAAFMRVLCKRFRPWIRLRTPEWLLRMGARLLGTETELVLKSRYVLPAKLEKAGFVFEQPVLEVCEDR